MANQYVSDQTKSGKNKDLKPECLAQENLKGGQNFMRECGWHKIVDISRTMLQMATSNMVVVNDTHRTQKQIAELFFQAFTIR